MTFKSARICSSLVNPPASGLSLGLNGAKERLANWPLVAGAVPLSRTRSQMPACRAATKPRITAATRIYFIRSEKPPAEPTAACPLPPCDRAAGLSLDAILPMDDSKGALLFRGDRGPQRPHCTSAGGRVSGLTQQACTLAASFSVPF